jgi:hypothetical protein
MERVMRWRQEVGGSKKSKIVYSVIPVQTGIQTLTPMPSLDTLEPASNVVIGGGYDDFYETVKVGGEESRVWRNMILRKSWDTYSHS